MCIRDRYMGTEIKKSMLQSTNKVYILAIAQDLYRPSEAQIRAPNTVEVEDNAQVDKRAGQYRRILAKLVTFVDTEKVNLALSSFGARSGREVHSNELIKFLEEKMEELSARPTGGVFSRATEIFGVVQDDNTLLLVRLDDVFSRFTFKPGMVYYFFGEVRKWSDIHGVPYLNVEIIVPANNLNKSLWEMYLTRIYKPSILKLNN
eukprot:TRINITY_DN12118_c0_g2_i1.p1 TRINITY_DN12118_c0_g2~~TRINITY_DN12118_c0_g2_i1.p1  ORF type:complete len:234 (+),score=45.98 TRINITY_DN12118_c0_g2_i1:88-702(+)